jgi:hypothetical protein
MILVNGFVLFLSNKPLSHPSRFTRGHINRETARAQHSQELLGGATTAENNSNLCRQREIKEEKTIGLPFSFPVSKRYEAKIRMGVIEEQVQGKKMFGLIPLLHKRLEIQLACLANV